MYEEVGAALLVPEEQGCCAKACASLAAWGQGVLASYAISTATLAILFSCAFPTADFTTDVGLALPKYLEQGLVESFELQLAGIVAGVLLGYVEFVGNYGLLRRLSIFPVWLRFMIMVGCLLAFPLAPLFVIIAALMGFATGDKELLAACREAVPIVVSGEFFESLTGLTLQLKTYVFDAVDLRVSLVISFLSSTKAALGFDFADRKYLIMTMTTGVGDSSVDHDFVIVRGPLSGLTADLSRTVLLASHRASEIASGVLCAVCFHRMAYGSCSVELLSRRISVAGPAFYLTQVVFTTMQHSLRSQSDRLSQTFLVPLTVPLPLFDAFYTSTAEHSTRACAQLVVALLWAKSHGDRRGWYVKAGVTDETTWSACLAAAGLTSTLMWITLAVISTMPASPPEEHIAKTAAECVQLRARGARLRNFEALLARREWCHPCATRFRRELLERLPLTREVDAEATSLALRRDELERVADDDLMLLRLAIPTTLTSLGLNLDLYGNRTITDEGLRAALPSTLTSLVLGLSFNTTITNDGLRAALPGTLTSLGLNLVDNSTITDDGLKALPATLTTLKLGLDSRSRITNKGLKAALPGTLTSLKLALFDNHTIDERGLRAALAPQVDVQVTR